MRKLIYLFLLPLLLLSCNSQKEISKEECEKRIEKTITTYKDYQNLNKDYVVINNTYDTKETIVASIQYGYDSENKLLYEFNLVENTKKWYYFEDKTLFELTEKIGISKTKQNLGIQQIVGDNYFKNYFSTKLLLIMNNLKDNIDSTSFEEKNFYSSSEKNYSVILSSSQLSYTYIFINNLLSEYEFKIFNLGSTLNKETLKIEYKKFTTTVNKEEFK